jgi:predicted nucleotidyltransferase
MPTYKINYDQLSQQPGITEMLYALQRGLEKFRIDFYLVGAVARNVWMTGINNIATRRTTGDIDFAVLINDNGVYEALKTYLIITEGFQPYKGNKYVLIWKENLEVDLLPFGAIDDGDTKFTSNGLGLTSISLQGFTEIYNDGLPTLDLEGKHQFKFCTLPGIVLLKLIAWDDRPESRRDDIKDISDILNHFFDMNDNEIFENHHDLFEKEEASLKHIAAMVMGREMSKIAKKNELLFSRIVGILDSNTLVSQNSEMAKIMVEYYDNTIDDNVQLLKHLRQGFSE